jgi:probable HAF family extracellular repeat protein
MTTYTYTTLSDPSAAPGGLGTNPTSINDRGQVVGWYDNGTTDEGFLYSNGTYKTLRDPSAGLDGETFPTSINDKGQVAGYYTDGGQTRDFLYSNGTWTTLRGASDPHQSMTRAKSPATTSTAPPT